MEDFAIGIAYGMSSATMCWVVGMVVRNIFRAFSAS